MYKKTAKSKVGRVYQYCVHMNARLKISAMIDWINLQFRGLYLLKEMNAINNDVKDCSHIWVLHWITVHWQFISFIDRFPVLSLNWMNTVIRDKPGSAIKISINIAISPLGRGHMLVKIINVICLAQVKVMSTQRSQAVFQVRKSILWRCSACYMSIGTVKL